MLMTLIFIFQHLFPINGGSSSPSSSLHLSLPLSDRNISTDNKTFEEYQAFTGDCKTLLKPL